MSNNPFQKTECNDSKYIRNLLTSLKWAKEHNDKERMIQLAGDLERFKMICGYSQPIAEFEASMKRISKEMNIENLPEITRAIETEPCKTCTRCTNNNQPTRRFFTLDKNFNIIEIAEDGTRSFVKPEPEPPPRLNPLPIRRNIDNIMERFPEICDLSCVHKQCSSYGTAQVGKRCRNRTPTNQELKQNPALW